MKRVISLFLLMLLIFTAVPLHAQSDYEVFMQAGDGRIIFLPGGGSPVLIRVSALAGDQAWFALQGQTQHTAQFLNASGELLTSEETFLTDATAINTAIVETGDYFLQIMAAGRGGYLKVYYDLATPLLSPPSGISTFLGDPLATTFTETFEDNQRGWWTGITENEITEVLGGNLTMRLMGADQVVSGFDALPGADQVYHYVSASVDVSGAVIGSSYGLIVRLLDGANFYLFQVSDGRWRFMALNESRWQPIFDWHADERLTTGTHEIGVWVLADYYILMWDGEPLGHVRDSTHSRGGVGFYAEVPPGAGAVPVITWDNLQVASMLDSNVFPALPDAAQITPAGAEIASLAGAIPSMASLLVGEWHWADELDTESMSLVFRADGSYEQVNASPGSEGATQRGSWRVEGGNIIVLMSDAIGEQRLTAQLDPLARLLTLAEYNNRQFVRIPVD